MTNGHYICSMKRKIFREDILKAGKELMFLNGYNATGIKEITDSIKIPKGSFYNHFSSKEAFGLEVLQNYTDGGVQWHKRSLQLTEKSPLEALKFMYENMIDSYVSKNKYDKGCMLSNFSAELADTNEKFREIMDKQFDEMESVIVETVKRAQNQDEISNKINAESAGAFIINSWHGALVRMKSTASKKPLTDFYISIFENLLIK